MQDGREAVRKPRRGTRPIGERGSCALTVDETTIQQLLFKSGNMMPAFLS